ncbi:MAG: DUF1232 domain-containing protein [Chloroflexi bacterium]|nr:DUF1232 domain-containing protein [Chloroflexota bacterium]MCI0575051.1 DUF1232 domain-containing protein [Chloroflexota bacterium]MCI0643577.1 DUF1232 domain-containing protein [Chloroflexota bacterium]MCI0726199.1 DUF1232 domain-containing protein [Chloroflexota bacterium]
MTEKQEDKVEMESPLPVRSKDIGFWREILHQARLVWYLLRDPDVPFYLKLLPLAAVGYVLFPIDLVSDFIPVLGQLDDITALLVSAKVFIELSPEHVVAYYLKKMRQEAGFEELEAPAADPEAEIRDLKNSIVIEGDYRALEDKENRGG